MIIHKYLTLCCILLFHQINCQTRSLLSTHLPAAGVPLPTSNSPTKNNKVCEALFAAWAYSMMKPRKVKPEIAKDFRLKKVDYNFRGNQYYISGTQKRSAKIDENSPWVACQGLIDDKSPNDGGHARYQNIKVFIDPNDPRRAKMRIKYKRHKGWVHNTIVKDYSHVTVFDRRFTDEGYYDYLADKQYVYGIYGDYHDYSTAANRWWPGFDLLSAYIEANFALWNKITQTFGMKYDADLDQWLLAPSGTTNIGDFNNAQLGYLGLKKEKYIGLYKEIMKDLQTEVTAIKKRARFEGRTDLRMKRKYTGTGLVTYTFYMELELDSDVREEPPEAEYLRTLYKTDTLQIEYVE